MWRDICGCEFGTLFLRLSYFDSKFNSIQPKSQNKFLLFLICLDCELRMRNTAACRFPVFLEAARSVSSSQCPSTVATSPSPTGARRSRNRPGNENSRVSSIKNSFRLVMFAEDFGRNSTFVCFCQQTISCS
jgi:hypothetical protein